MRIVICCHVILPCLLVIFSSELGSSLGGRESQLDKVIEDLRTKVAKSQVGKDDSTVFNEKQFGVYPCDIRMNFCCSSEFALLRDGITIFDNNAFVTLWVSSILLEAARFRDGPLPTGDQLLHALQAISTYHDKNHAPESGVLVFWPQVYNETSGVWSCGPRNLLKVTETGEDVLDHLHKIFNDLGMEGIWNKTLGPFQLMIESSAAAFHIPADFDDIFVNLGFGTLLLNYANQTNHSQALFQTWLKNNTNFVKAVALLKKYAYRPQSGTLDSGMVDPRTFLYLREYLYQMEAANRTGAFAVTWALNLSKDRETHDSYAMPFNTNNIDLTVCSNVVYGLTAAVLARLGDPGPEEWFDAEIQMIYENTTDLIVWAIEQNFSGRPDIALTYYPSVFNFYWFTTRTLNLIQSYSARHDGVLPPFPVLGRVKERLLVAMRNVVTPTVLKMATQDEQGATAYFDEFLGGNDRTILDQPVNHAQDRIFSTAMAVNVLLYTWMEGDTLLAETPAAVIEIVDKAAKWLIENTLSGKYKPWNVVFSGSVKGISDLPFWYPANVFQYLNGTDIPLNETQPDNHMVIGVKGVIPKNVYEDMLRVKHFNRTTPLDFHGYNIDGGYWPFWSSEPWTHAAAMLALSQYRALNASQQLQPNHQ